MNINPVYATLLILTLASCVFYSEPSNSSAQFHPPIFQKHWQVQSYPNDGSYALCVVTSGHNAIEVIIKKIHGINELEEIIHSTRNVSPGSYFNIRIGENNYRTAGNYFSPKESKKIIQDLLTGDTAYFEWHEIRSQMRGRQHIFYNMAPLKQFRKRYEDCRQMLERHHLP